MLLKMNYKTGFANDNKFYIGFVMKLFRVIYMKFEYNKFHNNNFAKFVQFMDGKNPTMIGFSMIIYQRIFELVNKINILIDTNKIDSLDENEES